MDLTVALGRAVRAAEAAIHLNPPDPLAQAIRSRQGLYRSGHAFADRVSAGVFGTGVIDLALSYAPGMFSQWRVCDSVEFDTDENPGTGHRLTGEAAGVFGGDYDISFLVSRTTGGVPRLAPS